MTESDIWLGVSSEPPRDVRLGTLLPGPCEHDVRTVHLDEMAEIEEGRCVGKSRGLLKVVRDDHDRELQP